MPDKLIPRTPPGGRERTGVFSGADSRSSRRPGEPSVFPFVDRSDRTSPAPANPLTGSQPLADRPALRFDREALLRPPVPTALTVALRRIEMTLGHQAADDLERRNLPAAH